MPICRDKQGPRPCEHRRAGTSHRTPVLLIRSPPATPGPARYPPRPTPAPQRSSIQMQMQVQFRDVCPVPQGHPVSKRPNQALNPSATNASCRRTPLLGRHLTLGCPPRIHSVLCPREVASLSLEQRVLTEDPAGGCPRGFLLTRAPPTCVTCVWDSERRNPSWPWQ